MARTPSVGEPAPEFELASTQGKIALAERRTRGPVLLVFYPGDDTPVCTRQLCDYRDNLAAFSDLGVDVIAINPQPLESHQKFADKHDLPFPLAADTDKQVCRSYGALSFIGTAKRALFLVGRDGLVKYAHTDLPIFRRSAEELERAFRELALE